MKFTEDRYLGQIPFPQGKDKTNCVLYCLMNLHNTDTFYKYKKESVGHDSNEEIAIINVHDKFWVENNKLLAFYPILTNAGNICDTVTLGQFKSCLEFWNYEYHSSGKVFVPLHITVKSKRNLFGRHRILVLFDGGSNFILCDPRIENFVFLKSENELLAYYDILDVELVGMPTPEGWNVIYFNKKYFKHIPLGFLDNE